MMKIPFKKAKCRIEYDFFLRGSVLKGTVESGCNSFRSFLSIDSDASPEEVIKLAKNAKGGCFAEWTLKNPVEIESSLKINGNVVNLTD
tara:strand:- start:4030 stop:4296 length:267 start_codon:yes stop_codon:yes gene_type:complete